MSVTELLVERRIEVLARWRALTLAGDPAREGRVLPRGSDPFQDPIGAALFSATAGLYDVLCGIAPGASAAQHLDAFVRIRSVQELKPSRAVGFVFLLRQAVGELIEADPGRVSCEDRRGLEARIDALAGEAFDVLVSCRQRLFELRAREVLSSSYLLLKRARLLEDAALDGHAAGTQESGHGDAGP